MRGVRQYPDHDQLQHRIQRSKNKECHEQGEGRIPSWIARLAHRVQGGFIAAIGKHQQQHRLQPSHPGMGGPGGYAATRG